MDNPTIDKNANKYSKDSVNLEEVPAKIKVFNFFFFVTKMKDFNIFLYCLFLLLESLQLISYSFTYPHMHTWKIDIKKMEYIEVIIGAVRITPLMKYVSFHYYIIIYFILLGFIFVHILFIVFVIKFNKVNSKIYQFCVAYFRYSNAPLNIFCVIPISELIILPLKCSNDKVDIVKDSIECYKGLHILYTTLGVIFFVILY
ncbi:MAG: hypothetical protein MJ252_02685, partial [archaeon]|nr:hypothetical protein [archaeon]